MSSPHESINPGTLAAPVGFSHAVVPVPGKTIYLGGQAAHDSSGEIVATTLVEQFQQAATNVVHALRAADAKPEHLVSVQIYVTDAAVYRDCLKELGVAYRRAFGDHYPAIALFEVAALFDPRALVELVCIAVVPDQR